MPTQFLQIGEMVAGTKYKLAGYTEKYDTDKYGTTIDVSELTLEQVDTHDQVILVKEKRATSPESVANFLYTWAGSEQAFAVKKDQEFSLKPLPEIKYKLLDVQPDKAIIINTQKPNDKIEIGVLHAVAAQDRLSPSVIPHEHQTLPQFFPPFLSSSRRTRLRPPRRRMCGASPSTRSRGARPASCKGRRPWRAASSLLQAKDFARAHDEFRVAVNFLPDALTTAAEHDAAVAGFCESGVKLTEQRIAEGKYAEAEQIVREVVSDRYDPNCRPALGTPRPSLRARLLQQDDGSEVYRQGRGGEEASERRRWLLQLRPLRSRLQEIRAGPEPRSLQRRRPPRGRANQSTTKRIMARRPINETRSRKLWQVQKGWEEPVRQYGQTVGPISDAFARDAGGHGADHEQAQQHHHSEDRVPRRQHPGGD